MKKIIFVLLMLTSMSAFAVADPITTMMKKYNCYACHAVDKKIVGPAFKDIAAKYKGVPSAEDNLVKKVSSGGVGTWGNTPMPGNDVKAEHQADIHRAVQFVLKSAD